MRVKHVKPATRSGSSRYQFTKHIPTDVHRLAVGLGFPIPVGGAKPIIYVVRKDTRVIRVSLRTSDPQETRLRHAEALLSFETFCAAIRSGAYLELSRRQVAALAGEWYIEQRREPDKNLRLDARAGELLPEDAAYEAELFKNVGELLKERPDWLPPRDPAVDDENLREAAITFLAEHQVHLVTPGSLERLVIAFRKYLAEGTKASARFLLDDYGPDPVEDGLPKWESPTKPRVIAAGDRTMSSLVEGWWLEGQRAGLAENTYESYKATIKTFGAFLGHDDAARVTVDDVERFKDHRLTAISLKTKRPVAPRTVRMNDLPALKSIFGWGLTNYKVNINPAVGITVPLGKKTKLRERDFTEAEARSLLLAASKVSGASQMQKAKRWIPWLAAYSGCRVGELIQLRKQDFRLEGKTWVMTITPEAGTVKGKEMREIPLHSHLVELGFTAFVEKAKSGYLFVTLKDGGTIRKSIQIKRARLGEFARETVKDPNVAPNHGWRHTFKSKGIEVDIQEKVLDAICGHAPSTTGQAYGSVTLKTKVAAMGKFPRYDLGETDDHEARP